MNNRQKLLSVAVTMACSAISTQAQAVLASNAILQFDNSSELICVISGTPPNCVSDLETYGISYFTMDTNGNGSASVGERVPLTRDGVGVALGILQPASGSHTGAIDGSESPLIDIWEFMGNTGMHQTTTVITIASDDGAGSVTLNFSGWDVTWNGIPNIIMGGGLQDCGTADDGICVDSGGDDKSGVFDNGTGLATLTCYSTYIDDGDFATFDFSGVIDCLAGTYFVLDYAATVPVADPSDFGGVGYTVHYEGTITLPPNTLPVANDTSIAALPAASHAWTPSVSDSDTPAQTLTCSIVTQPVSGTATVSSDCSSGTYTPDAGAGFSGSDPFTYKVNDGIADSATNGTVSVDISADPAPVCPNITATVSSGEATQIAINVGDCTDAGGTVVVATSIAVTTPSANGGTVTVDTATQIATYTPAAGFSGEDTFTYTVSDSAAASAAATATLTVEVKNVPAISDGTFSVGATATSAGSTSGIVTTTDIGVADTGSSAQQGIAQTCIGGCFDFEISGFTGDAQIVLPLSVPIPAPAAGNSIVYRKLISGSWVNFDTSGNNAIHTVAGTVSGSDVTCDAASDTSYDASPGLTTGHSCVRLTIVDNGPNDNDAATGTVADPGGIAETTSIDTRVSSTDGCSMSGTPVYANERADWWLVAGFIGLLGLFRLKRNRT